MVFACAVIAVLIAAAGSAVPAATVRAADIVAPDAGPSNLSPVVRGTVTTLPIVITAPGTYTLDRDYQNLAGTIAIDVRCSDVVIDGAGHLLDGVDGANSVGVQVRGSAALSGVTVKNLRVTDWWKGVSFSNARGRIEGVTAASNTGPGIILYSGGDGTVITGCTAEKNGLGGFSISYSPNVQLSSCTARENVNDGFYIFASNGARITGGTSSKNTMSGIALSGSSAGRISGALVSGCQVTGNDNAGIYMSRAQANTVVNNRFENSRNVLLEGAEIGANTWNTPKTAGTNIVGGAFLGGNWWSGFSETVADADGDGLADRTYAIGTGNSDALPLVTKDFLVRPGMVITVPGTYTLDRDIDGSGQPKVIEIRCSNVVINGNGHRISGGGQFEYCGIYVNNPAGAVTGLTIRDLVVSNCYNGIYLVNTDASRIEGCRVTDTPSNGMGLVLAQGSDGNTITGNRVLAGSSAGPGTKGVMIAASSQNTITNNEFDNPVNVLFSAPAGPNTWSGAMTAGQNIVGGPSLGGNYWAEPDGTGWSQQVADANNDGIGDSPCALATGNTDTLPLVRPRPRADFTATPVTGTAPLSVRFTDTSTGSPTSWAWSFGDGQASTQRSPEHTYAAPGTYTVSLRVGNAAGQSGTETRTGMITVQSPFSVVSVTPKTGMQGSTVAVTKLAGSGFQAGATVKLARTGSAESIPATNVVVASPTTITCRFGLPMTAATGTWNVVVTNPGGQSAALAGGFTVSRYVPAGTGLTYTGQKLVISAPGSYYLASDVSNCNLPTCIEIRASDVVFDGAGRLIDGLDTSQSSGIYVHGPVTPVSNVTIRNVRVQDWYSGIFFDEARNSRIEASTLSSNGFTGAVFKKNAVGNRIAGSTITGNNYGIIFSEGADGGTVSTNEIRQNTCGLFVYLSEGITVTGNTIAENTGNGLNLHTSGGGSIYNNQFSNDQNVVFYGEPFKANTWSVSPGTAWVPANIVGGPRVGGNYWAGPDGTGFSQTNPDANGDGFIDVPLQIAEQNTDNYPLAQYTGSSSQLTAIPGGSGVPTDTDGDGLCDDVNGNGRKDFSDVVLYFNQVGWIATNEPVSSFDFNRNGRIDFADTVWLFTHI